MNQNTKINFIGAVIAISIIVLGAIGGSLMAWCNPALLEKIEGLIFPFLLLFAFIAIEFGLFSVITYGLKKGILGGGVVLVATPAISKKSNPIKFGVSLILYSFFFIFFLALIAFLCMKVWRQINPHS